MCRRPGFVLRIEHLHYAGTTPPTTADCWLYLRLRALIIDRMGARAVTPQEARNRLGLRGAN